MVFSRDRIFYIFLFVTSAALPVSSLDFSNPSLQSYRRNRRPSHRPVASTQGQNHEDINNLFDSQSFGQEHTDVGSEDFGQQTGGQWSMPGAHFSPPNHGQEYDKFEFGASPMKPHQGPNNENWAFANQGNEHLLPHSDTEFSDFGQQHVEIPFQLPEPEKNPMDIGQFHHDVTSPGRGDQGQEHQDTSFLAQPQKTFDYQEHHHDKLLNDFEALHFGEKETLPPNQEREEFGQQHVELPLNEGQQQVLDPFHNFQYDSKVPTPDSFDQKVHGEAPFGDITNNKNPITELSKTTEQEIISDGQEHVQLPWNEDFGQQHLVDPFASDDDQQLINHPLEVQGDNGEFVFPDNLGHALHQKPISPHAAFKGGCNTRPPTPMNSVLKCTLYNGCKATCQKNYEFPSGDTTLFISCKQGQWVIAGDAWQVVPPCRPICLPGCQNNGICIGPNECQCPKNFGGPQCQFEKKPCLNFPPLPANSMRSCSSRTCTVTCAPGFEFPDGSSITNLVCKDGQWQLNRQEWVSLPDCKAVCDPPCVNGGACLALNTCQCPQQFTGPQCQYEMSACSGSKLGFNGIHNCSGDGEKLVCNIRCPPGIEMSSNPAKDYTCLYSTGQFQPEPIPSCVYGDNVMVIPVSSNSKTYYSAMQVELGSYSKTGKGRKTPAAKQTTWDIVSLFESDGKPTTGECFTWSGTHYKNFDGGLYSFDSPCAFTLVKDSSNRYEVIIENTKCTSEQCSRSLRILYQNKEYLLTSKGKSISLLVDGKLVVIPVQLTGFTVEASPSLLTISLTAVDVTLLWDGQGLTSVDVKENMWNKTSGLCGNLNALTTDDFLTKEGSPAHSLEEFTDSWSVIDGESSCNDPAIVKSPCTDNSTTGYCDMILNDPHFAACREAVNIKPFYDACLWDVCKCGPKCSCSSLSAFIRQCERHFDNPSPNWRAITQCPYECSNGKIYSSCGPLVQPTCGDVDIEPELNEAATSGSCTEGCFCPTSTVFHNGTCIPRELCPCMLRGKTFVSGSSVPKGCNTCNCMNGHWQCTEVRCGARCSSVGDPHYFTFDGRRFDFMGQCSYYLLKTSNYSVEAENVPCSGAISKAMNLSPGPDIPTCTRTITIRVNGRTIRLKQNADVYVNGEEVKVFPHQDNGFVIRTVSSLFLIVSLEDGVDVWWDGVTSSYIDVSPEHMGKTQGLCGTFNLNQNDDFLTPEGDVEQVVIPFANKWKTDETCNEVVEKLASHPCDSNPNHRAKAVQYCAKLKSSIFKDCHWHVDAEPFYQNCLYDVCSCTTNIRACFCSVLADYASECSRENVPIIWRTEVRECGLHCPGGQTYQACGDTCARSCQDISLPTPCRKRCVEGCNCPAGQTLDSTGVCIPIGQCPCLHHNLEYPAGHQLVMENYKGPQFCTCSNAVWDCRQATSDEAKKHSEEGEIKQRCSAQRNEEFTSCESAELVTCKNMHEPLKHSPVKCSPGCVCKKGFVWDSVEKKCVRSTECPCHHGGVSYANGKTIQQDCNTCECSHGSWNCTERICPAVCSTWGDSHFKTFDGLIYDFQGSCDFLLSGGSLSDSEVFDIKLQIVPCGSSGVSCPKAVTIKVGRKDHVEEVVFTRSRPLPLTGQLNRITVRKVGLFIFAEMFDLGVTVQWDRGTRVYVKVDPKWRNKLKGLCGNMNMDKLDDFSTPSGGISEVSPVLFADSWRLQAHCPESAELRDPCKSNAHRSNWAVTKCSALKSSVFQPCHSEVSLDPYYERCVLDTCGCDEGGDCECLCSAMAAYAHECSLRGVPIKWRSPELCPMQCDLPDLHYSSCVSPCPLKTCDNILVHDVLTKACSQEACIEGCEGKRCPDGHLFYNASFGECVAASSCKTVCLTVGNITYFEGDPMEGDDCHSCYCSRHKKVCSGVPCATEASTMIPTVPTIINDGVPACVSGWTSWINIDHPLELKKKTDYEPLPSVNILTLAKSSALCNVSQMANIRCRDSWDLTNYKETMFDVECSLERGLRCKSTTVPCPDFEISVLCDCYQSQTEPTTPSSTSTTTTQKPTTTTTTLKPPTQPSCPEGEKWVECSIPCNRTCHFFGHYLVSRGLCSSQHSCLPGCQPLSWEPCPDKEWLRDGQTCVSKRQCTCRSNTGELIKPGSVFQESECAKCQCLDNAYECDFSSCFPNPTRPPPTTPSTREDSRLYNVTLPGITRHDFGNVTLIFLTTPSTITPPPLCHDDRYHSLLKGNDHVKIDASSFLDAKSAPDYSIFSAPSGSWVAGSENMDQYLQVDLGESLPVYGVIVGGNPDGYFVTSYRLLYSNDGHRFLYISTPEQINELFRGPIDGIHNVRQILATPIEVRFIRFNPFTWHEAIAMKVDILGCGGEIESTTEWTHEITTSAQICVDPMGVGSELSPAAISVSTAQIGYDKDAISLKSPSSWKPLLNSPSEWILIDFQGPRNVTGIVTKGLPQGNDINSPILESWIESYRVLYSHDGLLWNQILDSSGKEKIFLGNFDGDTEKTNYFDLPINLRYLKLFPVTWHHNIALSLEVLGCYEPYPVTTVPPTTPIEVNLTCHACPGVELPTACPCPPERWWSGETCISRSDCPCFVGHYAYDVGSLYTNEKCEDCICRLNGVPSCDRKKCHPCPNGLRSEMTPTCSCVCKPCDDRTRLCPTSGICIPEETWCDGVHDCPDDETGCTSYLEEPIKCNTTCPSGYAIVFTSNPFEVEIVESLGTKGGKKGRKTGVKSTKSTKNVQRPTKTEELSPTCPPFDCVPLPTLLPPMATTCPSPTCPVNFKVEQKTVAVAGACPRYACRPAPEIAVCSLSDRTFNTFDSVEYKFDLCHHILVAPLDGELWNITVYKTCKSMAPCGINIGIMHGSLKIDLLENLGLLLNGFEYDGRQIALINANVQDYNITRVGDSLIFVSNEYNFKVIFDSRGNVRIEVGDELKNGVAGLCGLYNGNPDDDKTMPDGSLSKSTSAFGRGWAVPGEEVCDAHICPITVQEVALEQCYTIRKDPLSKCGDLVNTNQFISKCLEATCSCLMANFTLDHCRCAALQDFVTSCKNLDMSRDLSGWRLNFDCSPTCPPDQVFHECYPHACEPSCENMECFDPAPLCFPGCFCPEGLVRSGDACVKPSECRDCVCDGFGHSLYNNFDGQNFTFNGNCSYVVARDVTPSGAPNFQVIATYSKCKEDQQTQCAKEIIVYARGHNVRLKSLPSSEVTLLIDEQEVTEWPLKKEWVVIENVPGTSTEILLPALSLHLSYRYPTFTLSVPSHLYRNKTEGICGNCNRNPLDDNVKSSDLNDLWLVKSGVESCEEDVPHCDHPNADPKLCHAIEDATIFGKCHALIDPKPFIHLCRSHLCFNGSSCESVESYAKACRDAGVCLDWRSSIFCPMDCPQGLRYSSCRIGCQVTCDNFIEITEHPEKCPFQNVEGCFCPQGKVLVNGTCVNASWCLTCDDEGHRVGDTWAVDKCTNCTCEESGVRCSHEECSAVNTICGEGHTPVLDDSRPHECCPKFLCVPNPTEPPRECNDTIVPDCGMDQTLEIQTNLYGCLTYVCRCIPRNTCHELQMDQGLLPLGMELFVNESGCCPTVEVVCNASNCPQPPRCQLHYVLRTYPSPDCCATYVCEKPLDICIYELRHAEFSFAGDKILAEKIGNKWSDGHCTTCSCEKSGFSAEAVCTVRECPTIEHHPDNEQYDLIATPGKDACCPDIVRIGCKGPSGRFYKVGDSWHPLEQDPCHTAHCERRGLGGVTRELRTETCSTECDLGWEYRLTNGSCCGHCVQVACVLETTTYKPGESWHSKDNCTIFSCLNVLGGFLITSETEKCPDLMECPVEDRYEDGCCQKCRPSIASQTNCAPTDVKSQETIHLIQEFQSYHGKCINQDPVVGFKECTGACDSHTVYNPVTWTHESFCQCCQATAYTKVKVPLICEDGYVIEKSISVPSKCKCQACGSS